MTEFFFLTGCKVSTQTNIKEQSDQYLLFLLFYHSILDPRLVIIWT